MVAVQLLLTTLLCTVRSHCHVSLHLCLFTAITSDCILSNEEWKKNKQRGQTIYRNRCTRQWQATVFTSTTHISFSSWSRVDCSCSRPSCSCARISSWLVLSSSRTNSSFVCFSFTFSTLVTCCSLWRSWHWSSSWRQSQKQKTRRGRTVDKTPKHFLDESVVASLIGLE